MGTSLSPWLTGVTEPGYAALFGTGGRGLHSFTFQLNLSAFYGIRGCA